MTNPQRNSAVPGELAAVADLLSPGDAPEVSILAAAQAERVAGGISEETAGDLMDVGMIAGRDRETHRLVLLCDWARDWEPEPFGIGADMYALWVSRLRAHCPINATRCDADDAYRRAEWLNAAMLYESAADATSVAIAREEWMDRARDSHRQAYRDGLTHVDPGPTTIDPRNDWERAQWWMDPVPAELAERRHFNLSEFSNEATIALDRSPAKSNPLWRGLMSLAATHAADNGSDRPWGKPDALELARTLPTFMCGVALQVAALCGDRELFDRSWAELERRCAGEWRNRRREILTPNDAKQMMENV